MVEQQTVQKNTIDLLSTIYNKNNSQVITFISNLSHDLRTPMNAIMGFTDLMLLSDLTDIQRDYLSRVKIGSTKLLDILNNLIINVMNQKDSWVEDGILHFTVKLDNDEEAIMNSKL